MHLTLLISPERPIDASPSQASLPALRTLLARADAHAMEPMAQERRVALLFDSACADEPPYAAWAALGDGIDAHNGYWLRADPVHFQATRDNVLPVIVDDLDREDAEHLVTDLNAHLKLDGLCLRCGSANRWYLELPDNPDLVTTPLSIASGMRMGMNLPSGSDASRWNARMMECQMLLHTHAVNEKRELRGQLPVNGLWLWGGGRCTTPASRRFDTVCTDDPLVIGLARLCAITAQGAVAHFHELPPAGHTLAEPVGRDLELLERAWFAPMLTALKKGSLRACEIALLDPAIRYQLRPRHLWRIWRRPHHTDLFGTHA